jgi:signal transduction histidine kinase
MLVALDILRTPRMFVFSYPVFLLVMAISLSERTLQLKTQAIRQVDDLRLIEKQKLQVIYNISNEFQSVFDELKQNILLRKNYESALIRLNYLIESAQILNLLESKKYFLQPVKINLTEETLKVIDDVLKATKQKKNRLDINLPKTLTSVWMDIQLYRMILYHLLENALLYTVDEVELTISLEDQSLKIRVYDKGPGIPVELQDKIFDKYVRGNHSKIPGSGIGLTIVKECVMLLSGTIHFESKQDFYSLFEINIRELKEIT